jgi:hypothetical protein
MKIIRFGLLQTKEAIVKDCRRHAPDFLGLTILQFDTEEDLLYISQKIPENTRIVAGGPVFTSDPDFAARTGTHLAAKNVAEFLRIMLETVTERKK